MPPLVLDIGPMELIVMFVLFLAVAGAIVGIAAAVLAVARSARRPSPPSVAPGYAAGTVPGPDPVRGVPGPLAAGPASGPGPADQLSSLITLYQQGILSDEEFDRAKQRLLG